MEDYTFYTINNAYIDTSCQIILHVHVIFIINFKGMCNSWIFIDDYISD